MKHLETITQPVGYRLTELSFSYDGAPMDEERGPFNPCPKCGQDMSFQDAGRGITPTFMECEDCDVLCDLETEAVWVKEAA